MPMYKPEITVNPSAKKRSSDSAFKFSVPEGLKPAAMYSDYKKK
jgi:hypothetical protein